MHHFLTRPTASWAGPRGTIIPKVIGKYMPPPSARTQVPPFPSPVLHPDQWFAEVKKVNKGGGGVKLTSWRLNPANSLQDSPPHSLRNKDRSQPVSSLPSRNLWSQHKFAQFFFTSLRTDDKEISLLCFSQDVTAVKLTPITPRCLQYVPIFGCFAPKRLNYNHYAPFPPNTIK